MKTRRLLVTDPVFHPKARGLAGPGRPDGGQVASVGPRSVRPGDTRTATVTLLCPSLPCQLHCYSLSDGE